MAESWTILTLALVALILCALLASSRRSGPQAWPAWEMVLSAQDSGRRRYEEYEADLADELAGLRATLRLAASETEHGEWGEAQRALDAASRYVGRHVPTLRRRLQTWREAADVLTAIYPLPRLEVLVFRAWALRSAAAGEGVARLALDATRRFALRVYVLLYGLGVVVRGFEAPIVVTDIDRARLKQRLNDMQALGADLGALQGASLAVYKALLVSIHHHQQQQRAGSVSS